MYIPVKLHCLLLTRTSADSKFAAELHVISLVGLVVQFTTRSNMNWHVRTITLREQDFWSFVETLRKVGVCMPPRANIKDCCCRSLSTTTRRIQSTYQVIKYKYCSSLHMRVDRGRPYKRTPLARPHSCSTPSPSACHPQSTI